MALSDVKPGDVVLIETGYTNKDYREVKVKRVWKDGRIELEGGNVYRSDGWPWTKKASGRLITATAGELEEARKIAQQRAEEREAERAAKRAEKEAREQEHNRKLDTIRSLYHSEVELAMQLQPGLYAINLTMAGHRVSLTAAVTPLKMWNWERILSSEGDTEKPEKVDGFEVRVTSYWLKARHEDERRDNEWQVTTWSSNETTDWHEAIYEVLERLGSYDIEMQI